MQITIPLIDSLKGRSKAQIMGDLTAGVVVAIMLIPQAMAYALLAGLPPEVGLYASIVPLVIYGLMGSAGMLAVGPAAIIALMTGEALAPFDEGAVLMLTLLVGLLMLVFGLLRMGRVVNFLSHPVLSGFASGAAIIIALSQLKHLLGLPIPRGLMPHETLLFAAQRAAEINTRAVVLGMGAFAVLLFFKFALPPLLKKTALTPFVVKLIVRLAPLVVVVVGTLIVVSTGLNVAIVGEVPPGLPSLRRPQLDVPTLWALLPSALAITLVGYTESISVAKSLSAKIRERVDADQEFKAIGMANVGSALTGGFPVAGGLARSAVNFEAGARTGLASLTTATLIGATLLFLMPLFTYLPQVVLAAIIMVAIVNLIDVETARITWKSNKADFAALVFTFVGVLVLGVELGILLGVVVSVGHYLWRTSQPHIAEVGRINNTEHYRNVRHYEVLTAPDVLAIRVDENLYFANAAYLEQVILDAVAERDEVEHIVIIFSAVNYIDTSAIETLIALVNSLCEAGVEVSFAEVKQPVMAQLKQATFFEHAALHGVFLSTHAAMEDLRETPCNANQTRIRMQKYDPIGRV